MAFIPFLNYSDCYHFFVVVFGTFGSLALIGCTVSPVLIVANHSSKTINFFCYFVAFHWASNFCAYLSIKFLDRFAMFLC